MISGTKTPLITVGYKGMNAIVLGLFDERDRPVRYQRVPLDSRFPASPDMKMLMAAYQEQLKIIGFAGLGLRPVPHPQLETNGRFIGSKECESCHEIVVRHLEEVQPRPRLRYPWKSRSAAQFRSRMRQLPRDRLESRQVLPVPERLREQGEDAATG